MADSILTTTKRTLGLAEDYTVFDQEIIVHINSVLGTLNQLGIGPDAGLEISDATTTWEDFIGADPRYNPVKSYMYLRVRLLFDPPAIGYVVTSMERQKEELESRLSYLREYLVHPLPPPDITDDEDDLILDGGGP